VSEDEFTDEQIALLVKLAIDAEGTNSWWEFADRLDEMTSDPAGSRKPAVPGRRDGSQAKLAKLAPKLETATGSKYTVGRLVTMRGTARAWLPNERHADLSFAVHQSARSDEAKGKLAGYKRRAKADANRDNSRTSTLTLQRLYEYRAEDRDEFISWEDRQKIRAQAWVRQQRSLAELDGIWDIFAAAVKERRRDFGA
jgi:hypothetical protein